MITVQNQPFQTTEPWMNSADVNRIIKALESSQVTFNYYHIDDLKFEVMFRKHIINAAIELAHSDVSFATFYYSKCNSSFWELSNEGGFTLRPNIMPSDAIMDIYKHSRQYAFECATAMMIILYRAYLDTIGNEQFNQRFKSLYLWDWHTNKHFPIQTQHVGEGIPGDVRYFKNNDVNPKTPQWQGENTIQLFDNLFYGHGVGIRKEQGVIDELKTHRKFGANQEPYLLNRATRPIFDKLEDRTTRMASSEVFMSVRIGHMHR